LKYPRQDDASIPSSVGGISSYAVVGRRSQQRSCHISVGIIVCIIVAGAAGVSAKVDQPSQ